MSDHTIQSPTNSFLLVEDAARSLNLDVKVLRQAIACGLVPMRTDNIGIVRVHLGEVPSNLHERVHLDDVQPELHAAVLADELIGLEQSRAESEAQRIRLEDLVVKQGDAISRYSTLLDSGVGGFDKPNVDTVQEAPFEALKVVTMNLAQRDTEVEKLSNMHSLVATRRKH